MTYSYGFRFDLKCYKKIRENHHWAIIVLYHHATLRREWPRCQHSIWRWNIDMIICELALLGISLPTETSRWKCHMTDPVNLLVLRMWNVHSGLCVWCWGYRVAHKSITMSYITMNTIPIEQIANIASNHLL